MNYPSDSVRVKQTDRRARHQLLELLLGKIKASETNECTAFTPLLYNLYPVNPSITPVHTVNYGVGGGGYPNGIEEILLLLTASYYGLFLFCFLFLCARYF